MSTSAISGSMNVPTPTVKTQSGPSAGASLANANPAASLSSTFLTLLTQELQNQDPTAPMDSTAMVGQMISLNQLSQLTSINQTLSTYVGGTAPAAPGSTTNG
jgi:flagellar basal-body rod modification protein FlgD